MALSNARFILPKSDIKHPMQAVFNPPMATNRVGKRVHRGKAEQKVARFPGDLLLHTPFGSNHPNPSQAFPPLLGVEVLQDRRITDGPILSYFEPTVPLLNTTNRCTVPIRKCLLFSQRKRRFDLVVQVLLVLFE